MKYSYCAGVKADAKKMLKDFSMTAACVLSSRIPIYIGTGFFPVLP